MKQPKNSDAAARSFRLAQTDTPIDVQSRRFTAAIKEKGN